MHCPRRVTPSPLRKTKQIGRIGRMRNGRSLIEKKERKDRKYLEVLALLKKYKLDDIPSFKKGKDASKNTKKSKSLDWDEVIIDRAYLRKRLAIMINKVLRRKNMPAPTTYKISTVLAESLLKHKEKGTKGAHRALFQWLSNSEAETIEADY